MKQKKSTGLFLGRGMTNPSIFNLIIFKRYNRQKEKYNIIYIIQIVRRRCK